MFVNLCVVAATKTSNSQTQTDFLWDFLRFWVLHLWLVNLLNRPKDLLFLITCYWSERSFDNFSILLKENKAFKLQLKDSLLLSRDKPILNKKLTHLPWNCLIDYKIVTFIIFIVIFVISYQYIIISFISNRKEIVHMHTHYYQSTPPLPVSTLYRWSLTWYMISEARSYQVRGLL